MAATTYGTALAKIGVSLPGHLVAEVAVPIETGMQLQGDLAIVPAAADSFDATRVKLGPVPNDGIQVVRGEGTGNTHWLHRGFDSPGVQWGRVDNHALVIGVVQVPEGQTGELIHTDEHGCNAMGPGTYVIHGKREQADEIRRVAD